MAKENKKTYTGTGHRKRSVARVTLTPGTGKITVNGHDVKDYLPFDVLVMDFCQPLDFTNTRDTRKKERKKPGSKTARRAPQFSKR